jgi:hypothetical protein
MTWSLKLTETGDLALGSKGLGVVTNEAKLSQDIKYELLEKRGETSLYPDYGSTIDQDLISSVVSDLKYGPTHTNRYSSDELSLALESKIAEVMQRYQRRQLARAKVDKMALGVATLTPAEVLINSNISSIVQNQTAITVQMDLLTAKSNPDAYPIKLTVSM